MFAASLVYMVSSRTVCTIKTGRLKNQKDPTLHLSHFCPSRHGCSSGRDHRMPHPEIPQGPDEEGSRGCPDPTVGPNFALTFGRGVLTFLESHCVSPLPVRSPSENCGWTHCPGTAQYQEHTSTYVGWIPCVVQYVVLVQCQPQDSTCIKLLVC